MLSGTFHLTGSLRQPSFDTSIDLRNFGFDGRTLQHLAGDIGASLVLQPASGKLLRDLRVNLRVSHEDAEATISGGLTAEGELALSADIGNLDLATFNPWLQSPLALGGQATVNFDVTGSVTNPALRGDVFVDNLQVGPVNLESARVGPVSFREGILWIEEFRLRNGVTEGIGDLTVPLSQALPLPQGHLHISEASYQPFPGITPAKFEVEARLLGNTLSLYSTPDDPTAPEQPGIRGTLGSGTFTVGGKVALKHLRLAEWQRNRCDLTARFEAARVALPSAFDLQLDGSVVLKNAAGGETVTLATSPGSPLVVSNGTIGVPAVKRPPRRPNLIPMPALETRLVVGENVRFEHGSKRHPTRIRMQPYGVTEDGVEAGYLDLGGRLSGSAVTLDGVFASAGGELAFPNGTLTLRQGLARVHRVPPQPPVITVEAEANGRVGDYYVSMQPSGQLYPYARAEGGGMGSLLALNTNTIPQLDEAYVLALLVGPVVAPTRSAGSDFLALLTDPTRSNGATGEITGLRLPPFGNSLGMQEFSLDISREGPVRLRLAQRLAERLSVSYVSTLTGAVESWNLKFNLEVTPRYQLGWSVDEVEQTRWEVSAFAPF